MLPPLDLNLTDSEQTAFDELSKRISKDLEGTSHDEDFIYRFLKAKHFDVEQAEQMIKKSLLWRKNNEVDSIMTEYKPPEVIEKYFRSTLLGSDKEGRPIFYLSAGKIDFPGLLMSAKPSDLERTFILMAEEGERALEEQSKKLNTRIRDYIFISDTDGLTFANAVDKRGIEFLLRMNQLHQENYPKRLKTVYAINTSTFFAIHFAVIKTFLSSNLLKKLKIYGADDWVEEFREKLNSDDLPAFLGGERTDPDGNPKCETFVNHAGKVDEKYYIHKSKNSIANNPGVKKLVLSRADYTEIVIDVPEDNSIIEWEFEIKNRDIGFGLFYREIIDGEEVITAIVSLKRQDTQDFAETGLYKCEKAGTYVMLFDNSYSWIRSKEIYYKVEVVSSKHHKEQLQKNIKQL